MAGGAGEVNLVLKGAAVLILGGGICPACQDILFHILITVQAAADG